MKAVKLSSSNKQQLVLTNQNVHLIWQDNDIGTTLRISYHHPARGPQNPLAAQISHVTPMLSNSH